MGYNHVTQTMFDQIHIYPYFIWVDCDQSIFNPSKFNQIHPFVTPKVNWDILLNILRNIGFSTKRMNWIRSFFEKCQVSFLEAR